MAEEKSASLDVFDGLSKNKASSLEAFEDLAKSRPAASLDVFGELAKGKPSATGSPARKPSPQTSSVVPAVAGRRAMVTPFRALAAPPPPAPVSPVSSTPGGTASVGANRPAPVTRTVPPPFNLTGSAPPPPAPTVPPLAPSALEAAPTLVAVPLSQLVPDAASASQVPDAPAAPPLGSPLPPPPAQAAASQVPDAPAAPPLGSPLPPPPAQAAAAGSDSSQPVGLNGSSLAEPPPREDVGSAPAHPSAHADSASNGTAPEGGTEPFVDVSDDDWSEQTSFAETSSEKAATPNASPSFEPAQAELPNPFLNPFAAGVHRHASSLLPAKPASGTVPPPPAEIFQPPPPPADLFPAKAREPAPEVAHIPVDLDSSPVKFDGTDLHVEPAWRDESPDTPTKSAALPAALSAPPAAAAPVPLNFFVPPPAAIPAPVPAGPSSAPPPSAPPGLPASVAQHIGHARSVPPAPAPLTPVPLAPAPISASPSAPMHLPLPLPSSPAAAAAPPSALAEPAAPPPPPSASANPPAPPPLGAAASLPPPTPPRATISPLPPPPPGPLPSGALPPPPTRASKPRTAPTPGSLPPAHLPPPSSPSGASLPPFSVPPVHLPASPPFGSPQLVGTAGPTRQRIPRSWVYAAVGALGIGVLALALSKGFGGGSTASLRATSHQPGVVLRVDGKEMGVLPVELKSLTPGDHELRFAVDDHYATEAMHVSLGANEVREVTPPALKVKRGLASFDLRTPGATVTLVAGEERRALDDPSRPVEIDTSRPAAVEVAKPGFQTMRMPLLFEDTAKKTFVLEIGPADLNAATTPAVASAEPSRAQDRDVRVAKNEAPSAQANGSIPRGDAPTRAAVAPKSESKPEPQAKAEAAKPAAAAGGSCSLNFNSIPASRVVLDGRPLGPTPKLDVSVPAGNHSVQFVGEKATKRAAASCKAGEKKTVAVRM